MILIGFLILLIFYIGMTHWFARRSNMPGMDDLIEATTKFPDNTITQISASAFTDSLWGQLESDWEREHPSAEAQIQEKNDEIALLKAEISQLEKINQIYSNRYGYGYDHRKSISRS